MGASRTQLAIRFLYEGSCNLASNFRPLETEHVQKGSAAEVAAAEVAGGDAQARDASTATPPSQRAFFLVVPGAFDAPGTIESKHRNTKAQTSA